MKIDIHTHIMPKEMPDFKEKFGYGGFIVLDHHADCRARMMRDDGKFFREIEENCWDGPARLKDCEQFNVDVQVLSTIPVLFSYWAEPEHCLAVSEYLNDHLAGVVAANPRRFVGLGTVPMQAPKLAIKELTRCVKELGFAGIQIGSHVNDWNLNEPEIFEVFEAAQDLDACIFVHPWDMMGKEKMEKYWLPWLVGMPAETSLAICSMIFGGVFERLPGLRVAFAHGGGSFPSTIGRVEHGFNVRPDLCAVDNNVNPRDYLGKFYVDSLVHDKRMLEYLVDTIGEDYIALGTDYPFPLGELEPGKLIEESGLSTQIKEKLLGKNALDWLGARVKAAALALAFIILQSTMVFLPSPVYAHDISVFKQKLADADKLTEEGKQKEAMAKLIEAYRELHGLSHSRDEHQEEFVQVSNKLAASYKRIGDYTSEYRTLIVLAGFYRYHKRTESIDYADCLWKIGINCDNRKQYREGLANLSQAAEIYLADPTSSSASKERIVRIDRGLGHLYSRVGEYDRAAQMLSAAVKQSRSLVQERAHDLGRALLLQGRNYHLQGDDEKAYKAYREAVEVFNDNLDPGHLLVSHALDEYASFMASLPEPEDKESIDVSAAQRKEHRLRTLCDAYLLNSRFFDGKTVLLKLKEHYEKNDMVERMVYGRCLEELSVCCIRLKDYKEGLAYARQAVNLYTDILKDRDSAARARTVLAELEYESGNLAEADAALKQAKQDCAAIHGEQSRPYGECVILDLRWLLKDETKYRAAEARPLLAKLRDIYPDDEIPAFEPSLGKLRVLAFRLSKMRYDLYHEFLWHDWDRLDESKLF